MKPTLLPCVRCSIVLTFGLLLPASVAFAQVGPRNQPPEVRMIVPEDGLVVQAPEELRLVAQAWDLDGRVDHVEFYAGERKLADVKNDQNQLEPFHFAWRQVPAGSHELTARAFDNKGASTVSKPVHVTVLSGSDSPVVTIVATHEKATEPYPPGVGAPIRIGVFTVSRSAPAGRVPLTVVYQVGGTAKNGVDYSKLSGEVVIPAGALSAEIVVAGLDDKECEAPLETVVVTVLTPRCIEIFPPPADCYYLVGRHAEATVTIEDSFDCPQNNPPRVEIVQPRSGETFPGFAEIRFIARAVDVESSVSSVEFYEGEVLVGKGTRELPDDERPNLFGFRWSRVLPGQHTIIARATDTQGAQGDSEPVTIVVSEEPERTLVSIRATDPVATELPPWLDRLPDTGVFTVYREGPTHFDLHVRYTLSGSAENGADYQKLSGEVVIAEGHTTAEIVVDPINDDLSEVRERVVATVEAPACPAIWPPPPWCYGVGQNGEDVVHILDLNAPGITPEVTIIEPVDGAELPQSPDIPVTVVAVNPDGYVSQMELFDGDTLIDRQVLNFIIAPPPGQKQTFSMTWKNPTPGNHQLRARATDSSGLKGVSKPVRVQVGGTFELPVVTIEATDATASERNPFIDSLQIPNPAIFAVRRTGGAGLPLVVYYKASGEAANGVDYVKLQGTIEIPAGAKSTEIVILPIDDALSEGPESVIITLEPVACPDVFPPPASCYVVGDAHQARAVILDHGVGGFPPKIDISKPGNDVVFQAPAAIDILAQTADVEGWVVRVDFFANERLIGQASLDTPPPPGTVQEFRLLWDKVPGGNYRLTARAVDNQGQEGLSGPVEIKVTDGPGTGLAVVRVAATDPYASESGGADDRPNSATFRVQRAGGDLSQPLVVHYKVGGTAENGVDYHKIDQSVEIAAGRRAARILIVPNADRLGEGLETVVIELIESQKKDYAIGRPGGAAAVIADTGAPRPRTGLLADGRFYLWIDANDDHGSRFEILSSDDLKEWRALGSAVSEAGGLYFVDPTPNRDAGRFYRVIPATAAAEEDEGE